MINYKKYYNQIGDISTQEIVQEITANEDCDSRLKDIAKKYKALDVVTDKFDNYDELEDEYIMLDNQAEEIIEELAEEE